MPEDPVDAYRAMQRSIPGIDGLYAAARAILAAATEAEGDVLVVGAGGGRELELFADLPRARHLLAVDISAERLARTRERLEAAGLGPRVSDVVGGVDAVPGATACVAATALLVMHALPDDGTKLGFLRAIRSRLMPGAPFVLADISVDDPAEFERTVPVFLEHATRAGVARQHAEIDPRVIPSMPVIGDRRTRALLTEAGFGDITPFFRGFWYAGLWARAV